MAPGASDTTPFFAYEWVDDHILVEPDPGECCCIAEDTLRLAMMAVLGPHAINEAKFSSWGTQLRELGLEWDCMARTVSIPADKITKALTRVEAATTSPRISSVDLRRLLGSLRHVASCLRAAKPFYQRLHALVASAPRYGSIAVTTWVVDDLFWFETILRYGHLSGVPTYLFGSMPQPNVHLHMDASGDGLCVLDPAGERYITVALSASL
ncbi:unnamed protein product [Phytophthora fragariaefolia]|uniref:Unnamed protein product n=1 Tax=Phytophthora fragariaefolia TaxID=1490495 RepID=A0A9W6YMY8_9STRA|nr:unnamed protein product [Phytophthora fragariaefolia]